MENDQTEFACPICFDIPPAEIYQCKNGHTICHVCSSTIAACPQCRVQLGADKIRCRALEIVLDKQIFSCSNSHLGCQVKLSRRELPAHFQACIFRVIEIHMCRNMGYNCDFVTTSNNISNVLQHFQEVHQAIVFENSTAGLLLYKDIQVNETRVWSPLILEVETAFEGHVKKVQFMTVAKVNGEDQTFSLVTICLDKSNELAEIFGVSYNIISEEESVSPLEWKTSVISLPEAEEVLNAPALRIPITRLQSKYADSEYLRAIVSVFKNPQQLGNVFEWRVAIPEENRTEAHHPVNSKVIANDAHISPGVCCNACKIKPIKGAYRHCLQCADYDLCNNCYKSGVHSHHLFTEIVNDMQYAALSRIKYDKIAKTWKPIMTNDVVVESLGVCMECKKQGIYIPAKAFCLICVPLYGFCVNCFVNKGIRQTCLDHDFRFVS